MKTKKILLDGGPMDGQVVVVYDNETVYECFTQPKLDPNAKQGDPIPPPIRHVYKEDPNVKGHFLYQHQTP